MSRLLGGFGLFRGGSGGRLGRIHRNWNINPAIHEGNYKPAHTTAAALTRVRMRGKKMRVVKAKTWHWKAVIGKITVRKNRVDRNHAVPGAVIPANWMGGSGGR